MLQGLCRQLTTPICSLQLMLATGCSLVVLSELLPLFALLFLHLCIFFSFCGIPSAVESSRKQIMRQKRSVEAAPAFSALLSDDFLLFLVITCLTLNKSSFLIPVFAFTHSALHFPFLFPDGCNPGIEVLKMTFVIWRFDNTLTFSLQLISKREPTTLKLGKINVPGEYVRENFQCHLKRHYCCRH